MGGRYVKTDEKKKILFADANKSYGHSLSQPLPYDEIQFDKSVKLEDILEHPIDSDNDYFVEVDLRYPDNIKEKTKIFPFCLENKVIPKDKYNDYMKKKQPKNYIESKKYYVIGLIRKTN